TRGEGGSFGERCGSSANSAGAPLPFSPGGRRWAGEAGSDEGGSEVVPVTIVLDVVTAPPPIWSSARRSRGPCSPSVGYRRRAGRRGWRRRWENPWRRGRRGGPALFPPPLRRPHPAG